MIVPCADVRVTHATFGPFRGGTYNIVRAYWVSGERNRVVEVNVSPSGRSVTVYVDGKKWKAVPDD